MIWIERLKKKWSIESDRDFWMIMLTFSLAGMSIMMVRKMFFPLLGITAHTPLYVKVLCYIPLAFLAYQIGLILWGTLLGQFRFFWGYQRKLINFFLGRSKNVKH